VAENSKPLGGIVDEQPDAVPSRKYRAGARRKIAGTFCNSENYLRSPKVRTATVVGGFVGAMIFFPHGIPYFERVYRDRDVFFRFFGRRGRRNDKKKIP